MKKTIYKYPITDENKQVILLPKEAEILSVQVQNNDPYIYAMVDADSEKEERFFRLFHTGSEIPVDMGVDLIYIGTFMLNDPSHTTGTFVGHLFEQL